MVLFSLAVLSGFINHMYLQNRHKCIEPLQEPWLNPASDLICKTCQNFWKLIEWKQKNCQPMYGNVMNWTCRICWTVFIDAKFISLSHTLFGFGLSFSLARSWKDYHCMSYCLVNCVVLYIIDYSVLFDFVLVIFQRFILQACMRHCCFSEWGPPPMHSHVFTVRHFCTFFFCNTDVSGILKLVKP